MWSGLVGRVNNEGTVGNDDQGYEGIIHYVGIIDNVLIQNLEDYQEECLKCQK